MTRTQHEGEDRREQIIDAALRVFAQKGFVRATNRDVAHEAGITTGLIYYYFRSKEDLFRAILEERSPVQAVAQVTTEMLEQPPQILLPLLIQRVLSIVEDEQFIGVVRVILPEMLHDATQISPIVQSFFQRGLGFLSAYLQAQVAKGRVRADLDVDVMAQMVVSSIMGMLLRRQVLRDPAVLHYTHEQIVHVLTETLLQGIQLH